MSTAPWQLQHAKNKFSQLVDLACTEGPQVVTRHGAEVVVVVSVEEWRRRSAQRTFKDLLLAAPIDDLDLSRDGDPGREVDFSDWA